MLARDQLDRMAEAVRPARASTSTSGKEDDLIRRMSTSLEVEVPEEQREAFAGVERGSLRISVELSDVNGDQRVQAPSRARPIADLSKPAGRPGRARRGGRARLGRRTATPGRRRARRDVVGADALQSYADCLDRAAPDDTGALGRSLLEPTLSLPVPCTDILEEIAPVAALIAALVFFLWLDLHFFARGREPDFREAAIWSIGWLVLSLAVSVLVVLGGVGNANDAVLYTTVYLIERSLSLDNLFVFLLLFAYFGVPDGAQGAPAVLGHRRRAGPAGRVHPRRGSTLIEQFHFVIYLLGVALLVLAYRIFKGVERERGSGQEPDGAARAPRSIR